MLGTLLCLSLLMSSEDFEVTPRAIEWTELGDVFDLGWTLPEKPRDGRDLVGEMRRLAGLRFTIDLGAGPEQRCFGDLVATAHELDGRARRAWLTELEESAPKLMADWGAGLRELLLDDELYARGWKPSRDDPRDGLLIADDWELGETAGPPWSEVSASPSFVQAAALLHADLETIKEVENDYRTYPDNVGADYEWIYPLQDRFRIGTDREGRPISTLALEFRCDLPFPFSSYDCTLNILNRIDGDGIVRTDIYSTSQDFHYLAGRDLFLPVLDSRGEQVAFLVTRQFGFDLDGVPDKPKHRLEGVRSSLGNLKRNAERRFAEAERSFGSAQAAIHGMRVRGRR